MRSLRLVLLFLIVFYFTACDIPYYQGNSHSSQFLRYTGNAKYKVLKKPEFIAGERVFFDVPAFSFVYPDNLGYYNFSYELRVLDEKKNEFYKLEGKINSKKISEFPSKEYLRFYFDSSRNNKEGLYYFRLNIFDNNTGYAKTWEEKFVLKKAAN